MTHYPDHQRDTAPAQPPAAPEPQTVREISDAAIRAYAAVLIQDYAAGLDYLDLAEHLAGEDSIGGVLIADLDGPEIDDMLRRILSAAHTAEIASSWPDGRQNAPDRAADAAAAQAGNEFQLGHGGGWCATCRLPMREGTKVAKVPAVVCKPCAADLAETEGRLDPSRLAARREQETRDRAGGGQ